MAASPSSTTAPAAFNSTLDMAADPGRPVDAQFARENEWTRDCLLQPCSPPCPLPLPRESPEMDTDQLGSSSSYLPMRSEEKASHPDNPFTPQQPQLSGTAKFWSAVKAACGFAGAGMLISVGYMDPGNWATDLAAGASFRYALLSVILFSNVLAVVLQCFCVKLGLVTGKDLAELCAEYFSVVPRVILWILAECAIVATDLAELIGSAIALNLLFGLPLPWGVAIMSIDVLLILIGWRKSTQRIFELAIAMLVAAVGICFIVLLTLAKPDWNEVFAGFVPSTIIFTDSSALYLAMGIIGATIMPHSIFLHSHLIINRTATSLSKPAEPAEKKSRAQTFLSFLRGDSEPDLPAASPVVVDVAPNAAPQVYKFSMRGALRLYYVDTVGALTIALCINSAILIVSAATFSNLGIEISSIPDAFRFMKQALGAGAAYTFAVALFFSGQSSVITGTMAGQVVANGFLGRNSRIVKYLRPWVRRLITRLLAVIPAMCAALIGGEEAINKMLIGSQVALSIQLPFAVWPLILFTSSKAIMKVWNDDSGTGWKRMKSDESPEQKAIREEEEMFKDEWEDDATMNSETSPDRPPSADGATLDVGRDTDDEVAEAPQNQSTPGPASPPPFVAEVRRTSAESRRSVALESLGRNRSANVEVEMDGQDLVGKPEATAITIPKPRHVVDYTFVNSWPMKIIGGLIASVLTALNIWLVVQVARGEMESHH